jgi:subtilisin family serine protease
MRVLVMLIVIATTASGQTGSVVQLYEKGLGKDIALAESTRYSALAPATPESSAAFSSMMIKKSAPSPTSDVSVLRRAGILLVKKNLPGPSSASPLFSKFKTGSKSIPVYAFGGADLVPQNEIVVKSADEAMSDALTKYLRTLGTVRTIAPNRVMLRIPAGSGVIGTARQIAQRADVAFAEPNFIAVLPSRPSVLPGNPTPTARPAGNSAPNSAVFPSDPDFAEEWFLENRLEDSKGAKGADVHSVLAWKAVTGTDKVVIAILDEGVDVNHPDLRAKIVTPYDATSGQDGGGVNAWDGHGTACAGIAAAATNNGVGIAGVGLDARILPVRIASSEKPAQPGDAHPWITTWEIIADGIRKATDRGADVLSNSWGGGYSDEVTDAIRYALTKGRGGKGAVVVFAAGNEASQVNWPASLSATYPVIAVAATNEWDELKTKTSRDGENWWGTNTGPEITVTAPGVHMFTTDISGAGGYSSTDYIATFNGTSSATPVVAGIAALVLAKHPDWGPSEVRQQIAKTADPIQGVSTFGRANACKAVGANTCQ